MIEINSISLSQAAVSLTSDPLEADGYETVQETLAHSANNAQIPPV